MAQFQELAAEDPRQVGRYRVLARLGAGGMGRVFLARSPGGRPVAVKVVRAELADDPEFRRRFAREVAAARRVNGFFTAGVVDADPDGSPPWLATAYVAGMPLVEAVTAYGPWPQGAVRALGVGLAEALEAIHGAGLVHRDLKPSNVLLAPDGPRVIDFGISLAADATALTQTGAAVGTPGFMSPEQLTGKGVTPASDVFALGAVLAYAATGEGPFGTGAAHAVNFRVAYEPAELARVPEGGGLRELLAACLEKDPARRPGVASLLERLGVGAGGGAAAALDWLPEPVARSVRERTDAALPATPPSPTVPTVPNAGGAFGPPVPPRPHHLPGPPRQGGGPSRRGLLAAGGGAAALAGLGALAWSFGGGGDGSSGGTAGGTDGGNSGNSGNSGDPGSPSTSSSPDDGSGQTRTVRIAVQAPLTGGNEAFGQDLLAAARLAVDEANANGGYPGLRFEIAEADDQGLAERATAAAQMAIDDTGVLAVLGPAFSGTADVACPLYADAGLACVTPSATNSTLTQQGYATFLRAVPDDRQSGVAIAEFLAQLDVEDVMVVDDSSAYSVDVADAVEERLAELSVSALRESVPGDAAGMDATAQAVVSSGATGLAFLGYYDQAADLAGALAERGFAGVRVSGDGAMDPSLPDLGGGAVEGWYLVSSGCDVTDSSGGREFIQRFRTEHGRVPGLYAPRAYDVTAVIIEAVAALGAGADREGVFEALAGVRYDGITGEIEFGEGGEYRGVGPDLYRVDGGEFAPHGPVEDFRD
ncbi:bifunctional serine/threonine-protein kinase/ABC transporter substrate-binding protein [Streptomyces sp. 6N223]|uniref:bifunctional serine/threonine-protein kinase/ABC transporter substrate-binding protein n=1 Tax=Streptomyces sp. 6N223 TaxID=3457412 RepID=UPI003FD5AD24